MGKDCAFGIMGKGVAAQRDIAGTMRGYAMPENRVEPFTGGEYKTLGGRPDRGDEDGVAPKELKIRQWAYRIKKRRVHWKKKNARGNGK